MTTAETTSGVLPTLAEVPAAELRVAVLGVGMMGADHVARLHSRISGARVVVVSDAFAEKAEQVAGTVPGCRVLAEDIPFPTAVRMGAMVEPPQGVPDLPSLLEAVEELDLDVFAIVEHDMYPCPPDQPFPIAQRTHRHIGSCRLPSLEIGRPTSSVEGRA